MSQIVIQYLACAIAALEKAQREIRKEESITTVRTAGQPIVNKVSDVIPHITHLREFTHSNSATKLREPGFSRQDAKVVFENHGLKLSLKTIEYRLEALVRRGILDKRKSGRDILYTVKVSDDELRDII